MSQYRLPPEVRNSKHIPQAKVQVHQSAEQTREARSRIGLPALRSGQDITITQQLPKEMFGENKTITINTNHWSPTPAIILSYMLSGGDGSGKSLDGVNAIEVRVKAIDDCPESVLIMFVKSVLTP